jgi:hypothetical protein
MSGCPADLGIGGWFSCRLPFWRREVRGRWCGGIRVRFRLVAMPAPQPIYTDCYQIKFRCMRRRRRSHFDGLRRLSRLIPARQRRKVVTVRSGQFCGFSDNSSGACIIAEFKAPASYSRSHTRFQRLNRRRRRRLGALSIACSRKNWRRNLNSALTIESVFW